jgi:hypothetical protein
MHIRPPDLNLSKTPGPGAYTPSNPGSPRGPLYTLKSRVVLKSYVNIAPYRALPSAIGEGPKIALSSRHKEPKIFSTPSPDAYSPDYRKVKKSSPTPMVHSRFIDPSPPILPGPGEYSPDYRKIRPAAPQPTMHAKPREPGPDYAVAYRQLPSTFSGPRFTIKHRETVGMTAT